MSTLQVLKSACEVNITLRTKIPSISGFSCRRIGQDCFGGSRLCEGNTDSYHLIPKGISNAIAVNYLCKDCLPSNKESEGWDLVEPGDAIEMAVISKIYRKKVRS